MNAYLRSGSRKDILQCGQKGIVVHKIRMMVDKKSPMITWDAKIIGFRPVTIAPQTTKLASEKRAADEIATTITPRPPAFRHI